jgi:hypothetical protein
MAGLLNCPDAFREHHLKSPARQGSALQDGGELILLKPCSREDLNFTKRWASFITHQRGPTSSFHFSKQQTEDRALPKVTTATWYQARSIQVSQGSCTGPSPSVTCPPARGKPPGNGRKPGAQLPVPASTEDECCFCALGCLRELPSNHFFPGGTARAAPGGGGGGWGGGPPGTVVAKLPRVPWAGGGREKRGAGQSKGCRCRGVGVAIGCCPLRGTVPRHPPLPVTQLLPTGGDEGPGPGTHLGQCLLLSGAQIADPAAHRGSGSGRGGCGS